MLTYEIITDLNNQKNLSNYFYKCELSYLKRFKLNIKVKGGLDYLDIINAI